VANLNNYDVSSLIGSNSKDVIVGGSGRDTITGGRGQDTLTGGAGKDVFVFNLGDSSVSAPDTITDFAFGTNGDTITWGGGTIRAGVQANVTGTGITVNANSVVTFATTPATLAAAVTAVSTGLAAAGDLALFTFGGTSYAFISDGDAAATTADVVVILTGVVLPTTILAAGTDTANTATGLTGFGI
jgi:Ca2+-binding RTX toxin-like protein